MTFRKAKTAVAGSAAAVVVGKEAGRSTAGRTCLHRDGCLQDCLDQALQAAANRFLGQCQNRTSPDRETDRDGP